MKPVTYSTPAQTARMAAFPMRRVLSPIERVDRYLAIVARARRLFARKGWVVAFVGLNPAPYTRIERAAWNRYCRNNPEIS